MSKSAEFEIDKPALKAMLEVLQNCGEVVSVFLKPNSAIKHWLASSEGGPLAPLFELADFKDACSKLGRVDPAVPYSLLNRLEFEGSLVSVLLEGGCHRSNSALPLESARSLVAGALDAVFPEPFSQIQVFRIDSVKWCELADEATISSSFVAVESARGLWWVLCVADFD